MCISFIFLSSRQCLYVIIKSREKNPNSIFPMTRKTLQMLSTFTILCMSGMVGMMGITLKDKELLELNRKRNKIKIHKK